MHELVRSGIATNIDFNLEDVAKITAINGVEGYYIFMAMKKGDDIIWSYRLSEQRNEELEAIRGKQK